MRDNLIAIGMLILFMVVVLLGFRAAVDASIDAQNINLCRSAQISGNHEWTNKCLEYYETNDIKYLREEK